jgi:hypothetical protein
MVYKPQNFVEIGALKIRFEGTPKGMAIRYAASDIGRIVAEAKSGDRAKSNARAELKTQIAEFEAAKRRFESERKMRVESDRLSRIVHREHLENERLEQERLEAERQRILEAAQTALKAKAQARGREGKTLAGPRRPEGVCGSAARGFVRERRRRPESRFSSPETP